MFVNFIKKKQCWLVDLMECIFVSCVMEQRTEAERLVQFIVVRPITCVVVVVVVVVVRSVYCGWTYNLCCCCCCC